MKLFKYSLLALATAFAFSSCDDDNKYVEGAQSPGAFFPKDAPEVVELPQTGNTVEVTIARTSLDDPSTYTIHGEDESGLFTFPTTVTFGPQEHTTTFTVTFDENEIITDELYPATVTVEGASVYGNQTYSFDFCRKSPLIITETTGLFYSDMWNGTPWDLDIEWCVSESNADAVTVKIPDMFANEVIIDIDLSKEAEYPDGTHPAVLQTTPTGVANGDGYELYWTSIYAFYEVNGLTEEQIWQQDPKTKYGCNFNDKTGVISLYTTYSLPDKGPAYWYSPMEESIHLAGYPDYSVSVEYTGLFIDPKGNMAANAFVKSGADVKEVRVANVATEDYEAALEGLKDGTYEYKTVAGAGNEETIQFPISDAGVYTLVAVSVDKDGKLQLNDYETYTVKIGSEDPNKGWTSLGVGTFTDGINGMFWMENYNPAAFTYDVEIQQKDDAPGVYRIADVFGNSPIAKNNAYEDPGYFMVDCTDPSFPRAPLQFVGWEDDWGQLTYGNYEDYLAVKNPGADAAAIQQFLLNNGYALSTFKDGVITIPNPLWSFSVKYPNLMVGQYDLVIVLPDAAARMPQKVAGSTTYTGKNHNFKAKRAHRAILPTEFKR
ncbi:MAG: hypothetical protein ACI31E_01745 [Muribaculaceae bacterium]